MSRAGVFLWAPIAAALLSGAAAAKQHGALIDQMKFGALPSTLKVGDSIRWTNHDMFRHSVTARDGSFDLDLPPGASGTVMLRRAGTVRFFCKYHPGMTAAIVVGR